jgi:hypothetical protein
MKRPQQRTDPSLERWLVAEAGGRLDEADAALAALFAALPPLAPPAGFTDRVMLAAALALAPPPPPRLPASPRAVRWTLRGLLVAAVALVALGVPSLPGLVAPAWQRFSLAGLLDAAVAGLVAGSRWLAATLSFWDDLARIGGWVAHTVAAPQVAAILLVGLIAAATALRLLADLIAHERSWSNVQPI